MIRAGLLVVFVASTLGGAACLGDRCGPDAEYKDGMCVAKPSGKADGGGADAAVAPVGDAAVGDTRETPEAAPGPDGSSGGIAGLGDTCAGDGDCDKDASYCAISPGQGSGYCTVTGCDTEDPQSCPAGYYCLDLSIYGPGLPKMCATR